MVDTCGRGRGAGRPSLGQCGAPGSWPSPAWSSVLKQIECRPRRRFQVMGAATHECPDHAGLGGDQASPTNPTEFSRRVDVSRAPLGVRPSESHWQRLCTVVNVTRDGSAAFEARERASLERHVKRGVTNRRSHSRTFARVRMVKSGLGEQNSLIFRWQPWPDRG